MIPAVCSVAGITLVVGQQIPAEILQLHVHLDYAVVRLSQPQISKLCKTTCPVQCGPCVLIHFLCRQDFFGPGILIIQTKKGKIAKNTTNSGIKKLTHS